METFRVNCVEGIEINADLGRSYAQSSPSISAALNHYIGYEHAADIAAEAVHTGRTVREVAGERTDLPAEQLDEILDPIRLARGLGQDLPRAPGVAESTVGRFPLSATPSPRLHQKRPIQ